MRLQSFIQYNDDIRTVIGTTALMSAKGIAYAFYLVLTTGEEDITHVWRLFQFWYKGSPENREAFREIERIHGPKRHAPGS